MRSGSLLWERNPTIRGPLLPNETTTGLESTRGLNWPQQLPDGSIEQLQADVNTIKRAAETAAMAQEQSVIRENAQKVQQYANTDSEKRMAVKALDDNRQTTAQLPSATKNFLCITGFNLSRALRTFHVLSARLIGSMHVFLNGVAADTSHPLNSFKRHSLTHDGQFEWG